MRAGFSIVLVCLSIIPFILTSPADAQFPSVLNYQVMLTADDDTPLSDQPVELIFRLYQLESGGAAGWTETHNTTTNSVGVATVILGSSNPLSLDAFPQYLWLEVEADGEILSPRRRLTSAPFAFYSDNARRLGGAIFTEYVTDDELTAYATVDDLSDYATLAELSDYATVAELSDYATEAELSTPGSVNDAGNPVDWTKLKNVPAGFADGTDAEGGAGDGHSLDAWDGEPVDAVWVGGNGRVGVGTTEPSAQLHVHRDTLNTCSLRLTTEESGTTTSDGLQISLAPFGGTATVKNHEGAPLYLSSGNNADLVVRSDGSVDVCPDVSLAGELNVFGTTSSGFALHRSFADDHGGQYELKDEAGNIAVQVGADPNGTGGRILVQKDDSFSYSEGIDLNGNWGYTEEPAFQILGSSKAAAFYMSETGNGSVILPADAVSNSEIVDEPGVASNGSSVGIALTTGVSIISARSIIVPSAGYVLVMASCQTTVFHTQTALSDFDLGVSDTPSVFPANQEIALRLEPALPSGNYNFPCSYHGLFEVASAGEHTFYFLGQEYAGTAQVFDTQLSLVFLPTSYGTVIPTLAGGPTHERDDDATVRNPLTNAETEAERARSRADNLARIESELKDIRAQVEAMREQ
jgi:hypothetical protein